MRPDDIAPTGQQWHLRVGSDELVVVEVGGGLRTWTRDGIHVVAGYAESERCSAGRGQQLIPWPNRIRDGRYSRDGVDHQLALTEVDRHNAIHGLVRWAPWHLVARTDTSLTVGHRLFPQPGWDWHLETRTTYALAPEGLTVTTRVTNVGAEPAPFGYGVHPYVSVGDSSMGDVELTLPAASYVEVDDRLLPLRTSPVDGTDYDFREQKPLGAHGLDTAYTDLSAVDGRWSISVAAPGRPVVDLWAEADALPWAQVFTGEVPGARGVAVEPMTCPPEAFNSGDSLLTIEPGATWTGTWGISVR